MNAEASRSMRLPYAGPWRALLVSGSGIGNDCAGVIARISLLVRLKEELRERVARRALRTFTRCPVDYGVWPPCTRVEVR